MLAAFARLCNTMCDCFVIYLVKSRTFDGDRFASIGIFVAVRNHCSGLYDPVLLSGAVLLLEAMVVSFSSFLVLVFFAFSSFDFSLFVCVSLLGATCLVICW